MHSDPERGFFSWPHLFKTNSFNFFVAGTNLAPNFSDSIIMQGVVRNLNSSWRYVLSCSSILNLFWKQKFYFWFENETKKKYFLLSSLQSKKCHQLTFEWAVDIRSYWCKSSIACWLSYISSLSFFNWNFAPQNKIKNKKACYCLYQKQICQKSALW